MELIKYIGKRLTKNGKKQSWGLFLCPYCLQEVERALSNGKVAKSCGCVQYRLISESQQKVPKSEEHRQKISETRIKNGIAKGENNPMYGKTQTKETIDKISIGNKEYWASLTKEERKQTEEHKSKISDSLKGRISPNKGRQAWNKGIPSSEETKKKQSENRKGNKNPNWNDGSSFEPYAPEFNKEKKQQILERDNYICQNPQCNLEENMDLHIHHIDYDKKNNNPENLITLCSSCHTKTNGKKKRQYYTEYYQNIIKELYSEPIKTV